MQKAAESLKKNFKTTLEDLKTLVRVPSVSFDGFPQAEMQRSAEAVAELMKKRGLENVEIIKIPGAHPYVYGERLRAPGKPTLMLYAHHDVQPAGKEELWQSKPFDPVVRPGPGGERLYGRGTADDKAGIVIHTAAIAAWLDAMGELPVNVKMVIEGEEETGSSHLEEFVAKYKSKLAADVLILTDTNNFDCGIPAITVALRGLVGVEVEVKALSKSVHSGMWGGPVPDPAMALSKILATLVDENGRIAVPGIVEQMKPLSPAEQTEFKKIPFNEEEFRNQSGMLPGVQLLEEGPSPAVQLFRYPSLTVNAVQASSRQSASNIINSSAWAKVTVRLVPGMDPQKVYKLLADHLKAKAPWGVQVDVHLESAGGAWSTDPSGPAFEAAEKALTAGYGKSPLKIGCGGSIGFVKPFADALGGAPALLIGVEDPYTNAHGENESCLVSDLEKACVSQALLFGELAERWRK